MDNSMKNCGKWGKKMCCGKLSGMVYILGFVGAAVYYVSTAAGFTAGAIGLLKALVWPAFLVHELLTLLAM